MATNEKRFLHVKAHLLWVSAVILTISTVFSGAVVVYLAGKYAEFARVTPLSLVITCLALSGLIILFNAFLWILARSLSIQRAAAVLLFGISTYVALSTLIFPLPSGVGMTSLADYGVSPINLVASIGVSALVVLALRTRHAPAVVIGVLALGLSSLALQVFALAEDSNADEKASVALSGHNDILVLSFDGVQNDAFAKAMSKHPALTERLRGFTYYDNIMASSPATLASIAGELTGNRDFKNEAQSTQELINIAKAEGSSTKLSEVGYSVSAYGAYSMLIASAANMGRHLARGDPSAELVFLVQNNLSKSIGPKLAGSHFVKKQAGSLVKRLPIAYETSSDVAKKIDHHAGPDWDRSLLRSWDDFQIYKQEVRLGSTVPVAQFLHFTFTHHPVDFDDNCRFRSEDPEWFKYAQNRTGLEDEAVCALRSIDEILARLESIGAIDDNLIVIKSDHGAPVEWNAGGGLESKTIRGNPNWGYGRYAPFLMTKLPSQERNRIIHDKRPAILDDLANSLCRFVQANDCDSYRGMNLFDPSGVIPDSYFLNVVNNAKSSFKFEAHETIQLNRAQNPLQELDRVLSGGISPPSQ